MIPLGIVSAAGAGATALPTFISLFALVVTEDTANNVTSSSSYDTNFVPNFSFDVDLSYDDPDVNQTVTLEATLLDNGGNPISYQSVYFMLFPIFGGSSIQIGTSSLDSGSSSTMITDSNGKISKTFQSEEWYDNDYSNYTILAAFDGNIEGTLANSSSSTGQVRLIAS
jgi:hypothetical protein